MRTALLYTALVGLPVLGLLGVLHLGQRLEAPPVVGGAWEVTRGGTCGLRLGDPIEIVQSGQFLQVTLRGRPAINGRLRGNELRARGGARATASPGCSAGLFELVVRIERGRLIGTGGVVGCGACPPRTVVAERPGAVAERPEADSLGR